MAPYVFLWVTSYSSSPSDIITLVIFASLGHETRTYPRLSIVTDVSVEYTVSSKSWTITPKLLAKSGSFSLTSNSLVMSSYSSILILSKYFPFGTEPIVNSPFPAVTLPEISTNVDESFDMRFT